MNSNRKSTTIAGLLYIIGLVAGILSIAPAIDAPDYLVKASENTNQVILGALFQFIMALAYAGIAIILYPILKKYNESLALGFFSFRIIAVVFLIIGVISILSLLALSQEFVKAGTSDAVVLLGLGWLGFQIDSPSFPLHPEKTKDAGTIELPSNLPEPVMRYYKAAAGSHVPVIKSAVVWGKAKLRINGIWMPVRFKAYYLPGQAYLRYLEVTWFGKTIFKVSDSYINGEGVMKIEGLLNMNETGEKIDQGQNLAMWGETVFMPSAIIADTRTSWEAVNNETARLVVPYYEQNDSLIFKFDPETDLVSNVSARRYRGQEEEKTSWMIEFTEWENFHSVKIPVHYAVIWEDEGSPWSYWTVEGAEYNIDVTQMIKDNLDPAKVII